MPCFVYTIMGNQNNNVYRVGCIVLLCLAVLWGAHRAMSGHPLRRAIRARIMARMANRRRLRNEASGSLISPATAPAFEHDTIAGLNVAVWRSKQTYPGPAPLIVFSHGFHGSNTQSTFLMEALAQHGYLVVAPNHKDARANSPSSKPEEPFGDPKTWTSTTYADRANDIKSLLNALRADPAWSSQIDWAKVGLAGHSLGGYTVLGLAGAWPDWRVPSVKAVLALSPYCAPYIQRRTLQNMHIPVMYQGGTRDFGISPSLSKGAGAYELTPSPTFYVEFSGAGHFAWTDLNPRYQADISTYSVAFFDKYVKGDLSANPTGSLPSVTRSWAK